MLNMMNQNFDLNLNQYIIADFKAVTEVIDMLGGIDIKMDNQELDLMNGYCVETGEVTGKKYTPIKPDNNNIYHLNGVQAVSYARIRYTAGNDFRRTARQRYVMEEVFQKAKKADLLTLNSCLLSKLKTLDFTDFCPIFWYNDCKDFDKNKSFFLQFSYRF